VQTAIEKNKSNYIGAILELLYLYGLRISEVLSIKGSDIHQDGSIVIRGSKKSNNRIVYPVQTRTFWQLWSKSYLPLSSIYSRFHIYREFKKRGVSFVFGSNNLYSTTHALRHIRILSLIQSGTNREDISRFIGHKSIKSIEFYEQQFKSKSKN
jgi:site-specific recombinase XerD